MQPRLLHRARSASSTRSPRTTCRRRRRPPTKSGPARTANASGEPTCRSSSLRHPVSARRSGGTQVVVHWSLGTVHGDCPPSSLLLSYHAATRRTLREPVHAASGAARIQWVGPEPPRKLTALAVSVDGVA